MTKYSDFNSEHRDAIDDALEYLPDGFAKIPESVLVQLALAMEKARDDGFDAGKEDGYAQGDYDAREDMERESSAASRSPMARSWQARFAPTGLVQGVWDADREAGTLSLVVSEWDAWTVLRVLDGAEVAR